MVEYLLICGLMLVAGDTLTLAKKAEVFQRDMKARFLLEGQALCKLMLPTPTRDFAAYNMPDNAYMTGIYLGAVAMQYAVTKDPGVRAAAKQSIQALHLLCTVSGKPGLLARAAWPKDRPMADDGIWRDSPDGKHRWRGDVSTDQVDGVLFGFSLAYDLAADENDKTLIARDVAALVGQILADDLRIIDVDGKVTRWGRYFPKYVKYEALNALLWLQALKVAEHVTGESRFTEAYRKYAEDEGYAEISVKARRMLNPLTPGAVNHSDDVLFFLGHEPLLRYETDSALRELFLEGFRRAWSGGEGFPGLKAEGNPLYAWLAAKYLGDDSGVAAALDTLRWFPLDMKMNQAALAEYQTELGFAYDPAPGSPEPAPGAPIPIDRREKTWSAWVQDPYLSPGERRNDSPLEYNGHDYLLAYWMGRYLGFVRAEE